jgi:hypothetical protein
VSPKPVDNADETRILKGRLEDLPLADILQFLQVGAKSGALFLSRSEGQTAIIAFRNGHMVQAIATDFYQTLGDRLVDTGLIQREQLHDALAYMAHFPGMRIGDALVDRGIVTRQDVENEVKSQMAETIEHLMMWTDADFEFRIGLVSLGRGMPDFAVDLILDKGVEPRHILLEAAMLKDDTARFKRKRASREAAAAVPPTPEEDAETQKIIRWFDEGTFEATDAEDPDQLRVAHAYLSISEELFSAQERGEMGLLLLRYASEHYSDGGLLLRTKDGFRVLGQFGSAFHWGAAPRPPVQMLFRQGDSPLFDQIAADGQTYCGSVGLSPQGFPSPAEPGEPDSVGGLAVPLSVMGRVSLILFCHSAVSGTQDARALIALARQVSVTIENLALREMARRKATL